MSFENCATIVGTTFFKEPFTDMAVVTFGAIINLKARWNVLHTHYINFTCPSRKHPIDNEWKGAAPSKESWMVIGQSLSTKPHP